MGLLGTPTFRFFIRLRTVFLPRQKTQPIGTYNLDEERDPPRQYIKRSKKSTPVSSRTVLTTPQTAREAPAMQPSRVGTPMMAATSSPEQRSSTAGPTPSLPREASPHQSVTSGALLLLGQHSFVSADS